MVETFRDCGTEQRRKGNKLLPRELRTVSWSRSMLVCPRTSDAPIFPEVRPGVRDHGPLCGITYVFRLLVSRRLYDFKVGERYVRLDPRGKVGMQDDAAILIVSVDFRVRPVGLYCTEDGQ